MVITMFKAGKSLGFRNIVAQVCWKHTIDYSRVPAVIEDELEEQFVRGSGPGGQSVNKSSTCVVLIHKPTGVTIKCHQTRSQSENRKLARELLQRRLDALVNGDMSVEMQRKKIFERKSQEKARRTADRLKMKKMFKEREGLE